MRRSDLDETLIRRLKGICGEANVLTRKEQIADYLRDETADSARPTPHEDIVVVKPAKTDQVSEILALASELRSHVFPRGGGTGLVGGAVPSRSGIVVCLERMKKVEIDRENLMATAEAGVTLEEFTKHVRDAGLQFPLHPGDESAQIGGLAAMNAGGANAIRYGIMRNYIKGIEAVLTTGEVLTLGGKLQKNNVPYDLMDLIIGSEGTLAVITKVIIRLTPKFGETAVLIAPYNARIQAMSTVPEILLDGRLPLAIEFGERQLMEKTAKTIGEDWPVKEGNCCLLITVEEKTREQLLSESARIAEICQKHQCLNVLLAEPMDLQNRITKIRSNIYSALKLDTADILDVTVPPARIGQLLDLADGIAAEHGIYLPMYGHVGDGNLHVHIMKRNDGDARLVPKVRNELYYAAAKLGGVITGEHGIGRSRVDSVPRFLDATQLRLMKDIKKVFDPDNVLNPDVKLPH